MLQAIQVAPVALAPAAPPALPLERGLPALSVLPHLQVLHRPRVTCVLLPLHVRWAVLPCLHVLRAKSALTPELPCLQVLALPREMCVLCVTRALGTVLAGLQVQDQPHVLHAPSVLLHVRCAVLLDVLSAGVCVLLRLQVWLATPALGLLSVLCVLIAALRALCALLAVAERWASARNSCVSASSLL